ncbi:MAG: glycosyltransferase family 4 protein [Dehalococcoidia bacterium]|nr:glycosyltransferase family 4 protein [Dehalococcoidia bacterium]
MKVAIVTDYYYPALGGITEHVDGQARGLQKRGHEVTVITGNIGRPPRVVDSAATREDEPPFEVIRMGRTFGWYGNGSQTLHTVHPLIIRKLRKLFARRKFDIIHTHAPYNPSFVQAVPFVAPAASTTVGTFHSVFSKGPVMRAAAMALRPSIDRLDGRIVVSRACIESLEPYFPGEYTVIPNGIDDEHFSPAAPPLPQFADGRKNILFLGRFDPRNGLDTMIRAFTLVRRRRADDVRLIIVGDGPLRPFYRRQIPDDIEPSVVWAGRVNRDRPRYYTSADILCTPCDRASFGMVPLEAMSCGVPVVGSANSGFQLLMEHEKQGLLIPRATDEHGFAAALNRLLDSPGERTRMGAAGRCTAVENYSWLAVAERLEDYYRQVIYSRATHAQS